LGHGTLPTEVRALLPSEATLRHTVVETVRDLEQGEK
jgi:hypothetical protein